MTSSLSSLLFCIGSGCIAFKSITSHDNPLWVFILTWHHIYHYLFYFISSFLVHREQSTKWESSYYLDRYLCPCTGRSTIWWVMNSLLSSNVAPNASALCHETSPPKHLVNKTAQFTLWTISKSRNCTLWGIFGLRRKTFFRPQKNVCVGDLELLRQWLKTADKIRSP